MLEKDLNNRFTYHAPQGSKVELYERVRANILTLAITLDDLCPDGREKSLAITKLEEAMFWANAAIARNINEETNG